MCWGRNGSVLGLQRRKQGEVVGALRQCLFHDRPKCVVLGAVVRVQVGLEHLPARGTGHHVTGFFGLGGDTGDMAEFTAQSLVHGEHHPRRLHGRSA
jgi:hypothetical protein